MIFHVNLRADDHSVGHFSGQRIDHLESSIEKFAHEIFELRRRQTHLLLDLVNQNNKTRCGSVRRRA